MQGKAVIIYIIIFISIFILIIFIKSPNHKGKQQEKQISRMLVNILPDDCKTYNNLYIPKENGEYTEIDLLILSQKGIIVIESKNYSGWIFGNERNNKWTSIIYNERNYFYNPIRQNMGHIKWLKRYIKF